MSDELGRLSRYELWDECEGMEVPADYQAELDERKACYSNGAPGRAAMLSRAQVRACLGPLLEHPIDQYSWASAIHAAARALLSIAPGEKSPLEED